MKPAPHFTLPNQDGLPISLADFAGKWVVLYFYPKDDTPGCTTQACSFRDDYKQFTDNGITILGVSKDTVKAHRKFVDKHSLPFQVLSDTSTEMIQSYGAWAEKKFMGRTYMGIMRNTYIINPSGEIVREFAGVTPANHAAEIIAALEELGAL